MIWAGGRRNTRCRTRNPWLLSQSQTHPVSPRKKMRRKRMMMMMATSPSMISGEILTRTRRMGKRTRSQVMGTKLKRKVPRFLKRREQDQGPRTLLRNVRGDHGHRALRAAPAHRGLGLDRERSESQEKGAQEALQAHLQVGPGRFPQQEPETPINYSLLLSSKKGSSTNWTLSEIYFFRR